jgi:DNA-binding MarR family transcriptional regulator
MSTSGSSGQVSPVPSQWSAAELGRLLLGAAREFSRQGQSQFNEHGLSAARVRLMVTLSDSPGIRMRDLATRLGVSGRAVTPHVDALEADGLVARTPDSRDRRAFRLTLTEKGESELSRIRDLERDISEDIFHLLDASERQALGELLKKFTEDS